MSEQTPPEYDTVRGRAKLLPKFVLSAAGSWLRFATGSVPPDLLRSPQPGTPQHPASPAETPDPACDLPRLVDEPAALPDHTHRHPGDDPMNTSTDRTAPSDDATPAQDGPDIAAVAANLQSMFGGIPRDDRTPFQGTFATIEPVSEAASEDQLLPRLVDEPDRVILRGQLGQSVTTHLISPADVEADSDLRAFADQFTYSAHARPANPNEAWIEEIDLVSVICRKSDGRYFGLEYSSNLDRGDVHPNGHEHGLGERRGYDDPNATWVFTPVEPFTITGFRAITA